MSLFNLTIRDTNSSNDSLSFSKRALLLILPLLFLVLFVGCTSSGPEQTVLLVSIDGFRWDYFDKAPTPTLDQIKQEGAMAKSLIPIFPSKTFPNHYSLVTGLYADHHGIVSNSMYDPALDASFSMSNREAVQDGRWWGGEPIWVTAEKQGLRTSAFFWPGSEAEIEGVRPTFWIPYDGRISNKDRIKQVIEWLLLPDDEKPRFVTLYFSDVDNAGHRYGPDSQETKNAISSIDSSMAYLISSLTESNLIDKVNLIITSDHGATEISPDQVIFLDDYIDLSKVRVVDWSPVAAIQAESDKVDEVFEKLRNAHPHLKLYRKGDLPDRLHFGSHPRIPEIIGIADEGWSITSHDYFNDHKDRYVGGSHGYDNQDESMHGIFIAHGPAFRKGAQTGSIEMVDVYGLMAHILNIKPAPNDGDWSVTKKMLK